MKKFEKFGTDTIFISNRNSVVFPRSNRIKSLHERGERINQISSSYLHHQRDRHQPLTLVLRLAHIVIQFRVVPVHLYLEQRHVEREQIGFIWPRNNLPSRNYADKFRGEGGKGPLCGYACTERSSCSKLQRLALLPFQPSRINRRKISKGSSPFSLPPP